MTSLPMPDVAATIGMILNRQAVMRRPGRSFYVSDDIRALLLKIIDDTAYTTLVCCIRYCWNPWKINISLGTIN